MSLSEFYRLAGLSESVAEEDRLRQAVIKDVTMVTGMLSKWDVPLTPEFFRRDNLAAIVSWLSGSTSELMTWETLLNQYFSDFYEWASEARLDLNVAIPGAYTIPDIGTDDLKNQNAIVSDLLNSVRALAMHQSSEIKNGIGYGQSLIRLLMVANLPEAQYDQVEQLSARFRIAVSIAGNILAAYRKYYDRLRQYV